MALGLYNPAVDQCQSVQMGWCEGHRGRPVAPTRLAWPNGSSCV